MLPNPKKVCSQVINIWEKKSPNI